SGRSVGTPMNRSMDILSIVLLWPLSLLYDAALHLRKLWYAAGLTKSVKVDVPVISIGNITAGGTGKTPMAIHVAQILVSNGVRVAVLSRGYKRKSKSRNTQTKALVVSDGVQLACGVEEAGDEPFLMASRLLGTRDKPGAMVVVGKDRVAGAKVAVELGAQALILDDGFQHWRIKRDLDIVLLDSERPFGNGWVLPAGNLREPVSAIRRASAVVFTRCTSDRIQNTESGILNGGKPAFCARHAAAGLTRWRSNDACDPAVLKGKRLLLFSGIARPESFEHSIKDLGLEYSSHIAFGNHHRFREADLGRIAARSKSFDAVIATEKDAIRLPARWDLCRPLYVLRIGIEFVKDSNKFEQLILSVMQRTT
ncbi:MAG: tetraacyldisaccharide 4'-kinase, partial [Candidatus Edwardsbacteria bacterium]|nr:tetraacyldisaccharide 4'-kinase [Candidatus Edwardsbacteria bacterium]